MTTIMSAGNSEGTRRCDARCHKSLAKRCRCICGGRYHGIGSSEKAQALLTVDLAERGMEWRPETTDAGSPPAVIVAGALGRGKSALEVNL